MQLKATLNNLRISPRKVRLVTDLVRGLDINRATAQLQFLSKRSAKPVLKLLQSAQSNASNNFGIDKDNLFVKEIFVSQGRVLKRWMPRAFGRVSPVLKRTSHITLVLGEIDPTKAKKSTKTQDAKAPVVIKADEPAKEGKVQKPKSVLPAKESKKQTASKFKGVGKLFRRKSI